MPDADERLRRRLRQELDRVQPLYSTPRYRAARARPSMWRLAPAALAAVLLAFLGLVAYSGSPNPTVWTEHVVTVIHPPAASPTAAPTPVQQPTTPRANPPTPTHHESPEQHESPEPSESPVSHESPEPSGEHSADGSDSGSASGSSDSGDVERS